MYWRQLLLTLALITALCQPAVAQDDTELPPQEVETPVEVPLQPAPTPTVIPTPAPSGGPAAPGTVLLSDNFDDPAAGRLPRSSADAAHYQRGYAENEYVLYKVDPDWEGVAFANVPGTYDNASLAADARIVGDAANRSIGLYCRVQPGSRLNGYVLLVFPGEGRLRLYRYDDSNPTPMTNLLETPAIRRANETNRLELGCAGPTIFVTVNGTRVASVGEGTFQSGAMRVTAGAPRATLQARLDNLVVTQIAEETPPTPQGPGPYDGGWTGSAAGFRRTNSFTVRNDALVSLDLDFEVLGNNCTVTGRATLAVNPPVPIANDSFSVSITRDITLRWIPNDSTYAGTLTYNVTGRFASSTTASGDTEILLNSRGDPQAGAPPCEGSTSVHWTATKN